MFIVASFSDTLVSDPICSSLLFRVPYAAAECPRLRKACTAANCQRRRLLRVLDRAQDLDAANYIRRGDTTDSGKDAGRGYCLSVLSRCRGVADMYRLYRVARAHRTNIGALVGISASGPSRHCAATQNLVGYRGMADMAGLAVGSNRSRMTLNRRSAATTAA
jgi:hypothetical protein